MSRKYRSGAEALIESLERARVDTLFGYPGGNILDVFNLIASSKFKFILARHEQGAVHMADGYARATGKAGVAIVTSGPGAANTITALATANMDAVPIVLISGQVELSQIGTDAFQEADMSGICRAATKHSFLVKSADEIPQVVSEAFYIATHGKPGTVVIDLPINVQKELTNAISPERISLRAFHPECAASDRSIALLAKFINESKRPVVYAGGGVIISGASDDLRALSTKAEIPVATTLMGIGSIEVENNLCLGMAGVYGTKVANAALSKADLIIALGTRFNDRITKVFKPSKNVKIVHIDCDPSSIEKNIPVTLGIVADIKDVLTTVASRIKKNSHSKWIDALVKYSSDKPSSYDVLHKGVIMPQAVIDSIAKATRNECILVTDVGQHQMFAARRFPHARPRSFISSGGMGTMGFGIPAAIGAAFAKRDEKVVAVLGDGGAQMTAQELLVAADENLPITFVVFNNSSLGLIRQMQDQYFVGKFTNPDFTKLAAAYGIASYRVSDPGKLDEVMAKAIRAKKPVLLEVIIDCDAKV